MKISIGIFLVAFPILLLIPVEKSNSGSVTIGTNSGPITFNLVDPTERDEFLKRFTDDPMVTSCIQKADYAVTIMNERDSGITREEQLKKVRARYEKTKLEPQGSVPWYVYIDFERMVRDIYRDAGRSAKSQYRNTDSNILWDHEFQWCAIR